jgi:copper homeostasis protein
MKRLLKVLEDLNIPVFVLIRPRSGNFVYSDAEFEIMKYNIQLCKDLGCQGIVSGILNANKTIDLKRTKVLVELSKPLPFTFHRAFDEVNNTIEALNLLIDLDVQRVLTSGQKDTAENGIDLLKELHNIANNRITILAGSGISAGNASRFKAIGLKEIHASASVELPSHSSKFATKQTVSDKKIIKKILNTIE